MSSDEDYYMENSSEDVEVDQAEDASKKRKSQSQPKSRSKSMKATKKGKDNPVSKPKRGPSSLLSNPRSQARDYSFKQRFLANYGFSEDTYQKFIVYKSYWEDKMFYPSEEVLNATESPNVAKIASKLAPEAENLSTIKTTPVLEENFVGKHWFKGQSSEISLLLQQGPSEISTKLRFGEFLKTSDSISRNGLFLNVGGHVTSIKWLPPSFRGGDNSTDSNADYLVATVIRGGKPGGSSLINNQQLALLNNNVSPQKDISHGIQIWKHDRTENYLSLYKFYLTESIGVCSDISWAPIQSLGDALGYLCGTSAGKLHIFKVPRNETDTPELSIVTEPSFTYEIVDSNDPTLGITCYSYLGTDKVLVGLLNGSIAEFLLPTLGRTDPNDLKTPSFIFSITEAIISSIVVGECEEGNYIVIVNSVGTKCFAIEYGDFQHGRLDSWATNSFIQPVFNANLKVFITDDSADTVQYSYARHPSDKSTMALKVDGTVTSLHLLQILNHPLILNGTSTGEIHILNLARKILHGGKATNKTSVPLRLWKFLLNENKQLVADGDMEPGVVEKSTKQFISPSEVLVSGLAWSESLETSSMYAAAIAAGVILVERLDPKAQDV